ncbi:MAG TPA: DUF1304 family protein [Beijerinckiaceae bacterium]|jgi:hypothetical protein
MGLLQIAAAAGALAQAGFAYKEIAGWGRPFVDQAAKAWIEPADPHVDDHIKWAKPLAFNIGVYNLVMATGLAWIVFADEDLVRPLALFFAFWLLGAALAAAYTKVHLAFMAQGFLGLFLLFAALVHTPAAR